MAAVIAERDAAALTLVVPMPPSTNGVSNDVLVDAYERLGSVHRVGRELGISHSAAHRRLKKIGHPLKGEMFSKEERAQILAYYNDAGRAEFSLDDLSNAIGRPKTSVARIAREMGLTDQSRLHSDHVRQNSKDSRRGQWDLRSHPRGFLGHKHSAKSKEKISKKSKRLWSTHRTFGLRLSSEEYRQELSDRMIVLRSKIVGKNPYSRAKQGYRDDFPGIFFRSSWEANYARYLNWLLGRGEIAKWEYEPKTFWFEHIKRGVRSYKPDFRITENDGASHFIEVKGWMDKKSKTKLKRMKKYYPNIDLRVVGPKEYREIERKLSGIIHSWEGRR